MFYLLIKLMQKVAREKTTAKKIWMLVKAQRKRCVLYLVNNFST